MSREPSPTAAAADKAGPISITARLAVSFAVIVTLILVATSVPLYVLLAGQVEDAQRQFLLDELDVLRGLDQSADPLDEALDEEVRQETANNEYMRYFARVVRIDAARGGPETVTETPNMGAVLPASVFPEAAPASKEPGLASYRSAGRHFRLLAARAPWKIAGEPAEVQLALDITPRDEMLQTYRRALMLLLGLGVVLASAAAWFIARRGLAPLEDIARAAERITADQLDERIEERSWPAELRALASAFDTMLARLDESFTRLSQFSADLAHELRTPINNLKGQTEVALSRERSPQQYHDVLVSNLEELERLVGLTESLLFLARAENTEMGVERREVDAGELLQSVADLFAAAADEAGVALECRGQALIFADPRLVRRAVSNLVDNALQHTDEGGHIELVARDAGEGSELVVRDDGVGIAPEHLPHLRQRLYRAEWSRSDARGSSGLGLAIVASIMDLHDGVLSIDSAPGEGTQAALRFPGRPASSKPPDEPR